MDYDGDGTNSANEREDVESNWGSTFSLWEEECMREAETSIDVESHLTSEKDSINHRLWLLFQASACSIAQLYKDRMTGQSMWPSFQTAAANVTHMYKECLESQKKINELCIQTGIQRRNKDMINWLKKKKSRSIRREEVLAFICGKSIDRMNGKNHLVSRSPRRMTDSFASSMSSASSSVFATNSGHEHHRLASSLRSPQSLTFSCLSLADSAAPDMTSNGIDVSAADLQPFRDALALSASTPMPTGLNRGRNRPMFPTTTTSSPPATSPTELAELNAFIAEEFSRNMDSKKRPLPSNDVVMSSPTNKKPKYL